jgi:hypothetical protein
VEYRTSAPVAKIENLKDGVMTTFIDHGTVREMKSDDVIFAAPMSTAQKLIKDIQLLDPEKSKAIAETEMTDYAVHVVRVKGHPYRATYDTWVNSGGDLSKASDYILGRWQDPKISAYEGMRKFEHDPNDDFGVITIYQPLGPADANHFTGQNSLLLVEAAVQDMIKNLSPLAAEYGQKIEVELVESFRWPHAIHVAAPGFLLKTPLLSRAIGNIHFVTNTVDSPELESAMARGASEARSIIAAGKKLLQKATP